jgi:hypothetical protein
MARADLTLPIGQLEEGIVVSGEAPLLDTTSALKQTVLSQRGRLVKIGVLVTSRGITHWKIGSQSTKGVKRSVLFAQLDGQVRHRLSILDFPEMGNPRGR